MLWTPSPSTIDHANITHYQQWLSTHYGLTFLDYEALWNWSVNHPDDFWESLLEFFDVQYDGSYTNVLKGHAMPNISWFEGISLNYAEHVFRNETDEHPAIIFKSETSSIQNISWKELRNNVSAIQHFLLQAAIQPGDRIAAFMPCIPETTMAFLATNSIGAVWSSCSPDFGTQAVIDRFSQIQPKILFTVESYTYNGKRYEATENITTILAALPSVKHVVTLVEGETRITSSATITKWSSMLSKNSKPMLFKRVPFSHPQWILYSSGTTGLPKSIVHTQGGILLEQLKYGAFHNDFKKGERCFWYTTTGWMMWNYIHASLLHGATMVLYDGSPSYPSMETLWDFSAKANITHFGTSAAFIMASMKANRYPQHALPDLRSISTTGSTLPPEAYTWIYEHFPSDLWLISMSGGTDVCSAFVGGNPTLPVYAGEIQCRALGCHVQAFDEDGNSIEQEVGEMVITTPMPSMPHSFWNDPDKKRYKESYFDTYNGVWRHGDWILITRRHSVIIYGRSDATLNRGGIRIGTSEIYRAVDNVSAIQDSLIICVEQPGGKFWMPLFVVLKPNQRLTEELMQEINTVIKKAYSPRHVPDEIIAVPEIPYTLSGKKTETPIKNLFMGKTLEKVINLGTLRNPSAMDYFINLSKSR
jgi:acetoacetyl-CoA synthetase